MSVHGGEASARVLADNRTRGASTAEDSAVSAQFATSGKDLDEHAFAVQSVLDTLRPHARAVSASDLPFTIKLPNLLHLATDVEMQLAPSSSALDIVAALHPTAAATPGRWDGSTRTAMASG